MAAYDAGVVDDHDDDDEDVDMRKWVCHICGIYMRPGGSWGGGEGGRARVVSAAMIAALYPPTETVAQLNDDNIAPSSDKWTHSFPQVPKGNCSKMKIESAYELPNLFVNSEVTILFSCEISILFNLVLILFDLQWYKVHLQFDYLFKFWN